MAEIKTSAHRLNETRHFAHLDQWQLNDILAKAVAEAVGADLDDSSVKVTRCFISSRDSSSGPEKYAEVEITVDHGIKA